MFLNRPHAGNRWQEFRFEGRLYMLEHQPAVFCWLHDEGEPPETWTPSLQPQRPRLWQWLDGGWREVMDPVADLTIRRAIRDADPPAEAAAAGTAHPGRPGRRLDELAAALRRGIDEGWITQSSPGQHVSTLKKEALARLVWPDEANPLAVLKGVLRRTAAVRITFRQTGRGAE
jgi:hypothetical protein